MGDWTGTVPTILAGDIVTGDDWDSILDELTALADVWTSFVPTWTASSVNPAIGNGTITGAYMRVGKFFGYKGQITMGSTTTFGTGYWIITTPFSVVGSSYFHGTAAVDDASATTNNRAGAMELLSATTFRVVADGRVDATTPFTWASGDQLRWHVTGEAT